MTAFKSYFNTQPQPNVHNYKTSFVYELLVWFHITDLNSRWPHVSMHKIYTWIPHAKLLIFIYFYLFISLFICLFLSLYYCFYLVILWSGVIILYQVIFFMIATWGHPNSNLYCRPTEEVTDKTSLDVAHTVQLCVKGKFKQSFSQFKMLISDHTFLV